MFAQVGRDGRVKAGRDDVRRAMWNAAAAAALAEHVECERPLLPWVIRWARFKKKLLATKEREKGSLKSETLGLCSDASRLLARKGTKRRVRGAR